MALSSPPIPPVIGDIVANRKVDIATGYVNVNSLLTVGLPHCQYPIAIQKIGLVLRAE